MARVYLSLGSNLGDRVALLYDGRLLYDAPPEDFLRASDPAVRQFVEGKAEGPLTEGAAAG